MAFFKFRPGASAGPEESASGADAPSVELLRRQARQRLIGASVLVVLAVAGFPMVFDTQPRPVAVDLAIDIPAKAKTSPEVPPEPLKAGSGASAPDPEAANASDDAKHGLSEKEELVGSTSAEKSSTAPVVAKPEPQKSDATKAEPTPPTEKPRDQASEPRFVVQVGAYAEEAKVREVRAKLEKAGLKTYVQVIDTKDGKRTRVRVGPFPSKAEAEKVAEKAKSLQLQAAILTY